jgi:UrcA family protein
MKIIKNLLPIVALALSGFAAAGDKDTNSVVVKYGDLNLNSQAGISILHKRITNAAESVCDQLDTRVLSLREAYEECVADAITNGIAAVDNASLKQFHASKGKTLILASNRR